MAAGSDELDRIRKSLAAAGVKENDLSNKDTVDIYNAILESEKTAKSNGHLASDKEPTTVRNICHPPKYNPPFYFNENLRKLSLKQRKEKICEFHYALHRKIYEAQRKSLLLVPWGRPISATTKEKFNGMLLKQEEVDSEEQKDADLVEETEEKKDEDVYVSQSGRQTKRKFYSDDAATASSPKKMKSPQVQNKYKGRKKLTNEEIMKRSSLFQDTPKTYTDKMFDALMNEQKKRQQEEEEMKRFQVTLDEIDADEYYQNGNDEKSSSTEEDPPYDEQPKRRRIVPPVPYKRKLSTTKKTTTDKPQDREVQQKKTISRSPPMDLNANVEKKASSPEPSTSNGRTGRGRGGKTKKQCPICAKAFDSTKVEAHAATCGETITSDDEESVMGHHITDTQTTSCAVCDKAFLMREDYDKHVQECIAKNSIRST